MEPQGQLMRKAQTILLTSSESSPENIGHMKVEVGPSSTERSPRYISKRPRFWTTHLVKLKNTRYGQVLAATESGCKITGGEYALPTNSKNGRANKRKINM